MQWLSASLRPLSAASALPSVDTTELSSGNDVSESLGAESRDVVDPVASPDYFGVADLFARAHNGHKVGVRRTPYAKPTSSAVDLASTSSTWNRRCCGARRTSRRPGFDGSKPKQKNPVRRGPRKRIDEQQRYD